MSEHEFVTLVPDYVLGMMAGTERADFEVHLNTCTQCQAEVVAVREAMALLASAVPAQTPPPDLQDRLIAQVREESTRETAKAGASPDPEDKAATEEPVGPPAETPSEAPAETPSKAPAETPSKAPAETPSKAPAETPSPAPAGTPSPEPAKPNVRSIASAPSARKSPWWILPWVVAGTGIAASIAFSIGLTNTRNQMFDLEIAVDEAQQRVELLEADSARADSILQTIAQPDLRTAFLSQSGADPELHLFGSPGNGRVLITAFNLPPSNPGRTYQLWGINAGSDPVSLGTFATSADGTALTLLSIPRGMTFAVSAVTDEPSGGSPQPTTQPFLVGPWSAEAL